MALCALLVSGCEQSAGEARADGGTIEMASGSPDIQIPEKAPATLLRRLAEAADGFRTGEDIWIVADPLYPHTLLGVYPTLAEAERARDSERPSYGVFGPFQTDPSYALSRDVVLLKCKLEGSGWCPNHRRSMFDPRDVIEMSISITLVDTTIVYNFSPDTIQAWFISMGAIERFVLPYYIRLNGIDWTNAFNDSLAAEADSVIR
jgi:hypothetical protein